VRRGTPQPDECDYDEFEVYWSADGVSFWYDLDDFGHRGELVVTSPPDWLREAAAAEAASTDWYRTDEQIAADSKARHEMFKLVDSRKK